MNTTAHALTVPVLSRALMNLIRILEKGAAHAEAEGFEPARLLDDRLFPDMFSLTRQVQIATDIAKASVFRLAGEEPKHFEDTETSFAQLIQRVERTVEILQGFDAAKLEGAENRTVSFATKRNRFEFSGLDYVHHFVIPNVYFHITTAYNILRHNGVKLGKQDFLGGAK